MHTDALVLYIQTMVIRPEQFTWETLWKYSFGNYELQLESKATFPHLWYDGVCMASQCIGLKSSLYKNKIYLDFSWIFL